MIPRPGKPPHESVSYRPIALLPVMSKLFEKLLIKGLNPIIEKKKPNSESPIRISEQTLDN